MTTTQSPADELKLPPHFCRNCGDQLRRAEIVNVRTGEDMGHVWQCDECEVQYIGFGDPHEYPNGKKP